MSDRLAVALREAGFPCRVEVRERLAIIAGPGVPDRGDRERIMAIAREHGFTHVALDVTEAGRAPLPRGHA